MVPSTKTERIWLYISCFLLAFSILLSARAVQGIRRTNQLMQTQKQAQLLMDESLQLTQQINAELWAAIEENKAIGEELKKPLDQRPADLDQRQLLLMQRNEGIQKLLDQQQAIIEQIQEIQKQNGMTPETESPETKAVLEKY